MAPCKVVSTVAQLGQFHIPAWSGVVAALVVCAAVFGFTRLPRVGFRSDQIPGAILGLFVGILAVASLDFPWNLIAFVILVVLAVWWIVTASRRHTERDERDAAVDETLKRLTQSGYIRRYLDIAKDGWTAYHALDALTLPCREEASRLATASPPNRPIEVEQRQSEIDALEKRKRGIVRVFLEQRPNAVFHVLKDMGANGIDTKGLEDKINSSMTFNDLEMIRLQFGALLHRVDAHFGG